MKPLVIFIHQSLRDFTKVGSLIPSSKFLAKRMTKSIKKAKDLKNLKDDVVVLELGAGTGVFTKEILRLLPERGRLISIEFEPPFVEYLKAQIKDKRLVVCGGYAEDMGKFLKQNGLEKADYIVSGLPLGNFKKEQKTQILSEAKKYLKDDGVYIQFQYFLASFFDIKSVFSKIKVSYEIFNFPPAFVYKCKK